MGKKKLIIKSRAQVVVQIGRFRSHFTVEFFLLLLLVYLLSFSIKLVCERVRDKVGAKEIAGEKMQHFRCNKCWVCELTKRVSPLGRDTWNNVIVNFNCTRWPLGAIFVLGFFGWVGGEKLWVDEVCVKWSVEKKEHNTLSKGYELEGTIRGLSATGSDCEAWSAKSFARCCCC